MVVHGSGTAVEDTRGEAPLITPLRMCNVHDSLAHTALASLFGGGGYVSSRHGRRGRGCELLLEGWAGYVYGVGGGGVGLRLARFQMCAQSAEFGENGLYGLYGERDRSPSPTPGRVHVHTRTQVILSGDSLYSDVRMPEIHAFGLQ